MRRLIIAAFLILGITPAHAAIIDTFLLPTDGTTENSTAVLANGTSYIIEVSGTFDIGCIGGVNRCPTDAEYYVPAAGGNAGLPFDNTGFSNTDGVGVDVGAQINGASIDWGPFQLSRVYSILFVGLGGTINMGYLDTAYGDNVGSLNVKISTLGAVVPLPAAVWLFGTALIGLVGFSKRRRVA